MNAKGNTPQGSQNPSDQDETPGSDSMPSSPPSTSPSSHTGASNEENDDSNHSCEDDGENREALAEEPTGEGEIFVDLEMQCLYRDPFSDQPNNAEQASDVQEDAKDESSSEVQNPEGTQINATETSSLTEPESERADHPRNFETNNGTDLAPIPSPTNSSVSEQLNAAAADRNSGRDGGLDDLPQQQQGKDNSTADHAILSQTNGGQSEQQVKDDLDTAEEDVENGSSDGDPRQSAEQRIVLGISSTDNRQPPAASRSFDSGQGTNAGEETTAEDLTGSNSQFPTEREISDEDSIPPLDDGDDTVTCASSNSDVGGQAASKALDNERDSVDGIGGPMPQNQSEDSKSKDDSYPSSIQRNESTAAISPSSLKSNSTEIDNADLADSAATRSESLENLKQEDDKTDRNIESTSTSNVGGEAGWDEMLNVEDVEGEDELKAGQTGENQDTETSSSVETSNTNATEADGTDTTSDTEDSISTDEEDTLFQEEDDTEKHSIMPRQPDTLVSPVSLDAATHVGAEEEKTEVDEYLVKSPQEEVNLEGILALPEPPDVEGSIPVIPEFDDGGRSVPPIIENKRAEYVSVTVLKLDASYQHGLEFMMVEGGLRVSHILPDGLFAGSPLSAFDKMLRINDLIVEQLDPQNATHLLDVLTGSVTVIAQNPGGVSDLVESQVTKPLVQSLLGIEFVETCVDSKLAKYRLEISRVGQKSLFSAALLHVGDVVVAINGSGDMDVHTGNLLLSTAPKTCVITARTKLDTRMAISRRPAHLLPPGFNFVRAMEEAQRQREELRRKQGCYYNSCERPGACASIFQWLGTVYVIIIVVVGLGISWQKIKEETNDGSDAVGTILKFAFLLVGGILLGFLVNAPWWYRKVGARFSIAQLVCNVIFVVSFFIFTWVFDGGTLAAPEHRQAIFFSLFFPLLIIVNLPSVFVKTEDGSDGNTISDRSPSDDEMSDTSDV